MNHGATKPLTQEELGRYHRQLMLPEVGEVGQKRLKAASVLLVGAGGLGAPASLYLAAAGVGRLGLLDFDRVEVSNLHRQILFDSTDLGEHKVEVARQRLAALNPDIELIPHPVRLTDENALDLVRSYDLVIDGSDAFSTRYAVNDACVTAGRAVVGASISQYEGQVSVYCATGGPCYRCIFREPPPADLVPSCAEGGVLGVLPGLLGIIQATEALKLLLGLGEPLIGRLLLVDMLGMHFRTLNFDRDPDCPVCGRQPKITTPQGFRTACASPEMSPVPEISVHDYSRLRHGETPPFLLDVRKPEEYAIANLGGALIPLDELTDRIEELEPHRDDAILVVHCRSGARSARAVALLHQRGFSNAVNLQGGILAWSDEIDPSVARY